MIRAIVVEDEELILSQIRTMVQETGFINVAKAYGTSMDALNDVESIRPQVAFIDIKMPGMDGITLAEKLLERVPALYCVFITAYNEYAVKAFELNALDYLLKPISPRRFVRMVERIAATISDQSSCPPKLLEIQCFGGLDVKIGGQGVKWVRSKAEELFCFLLMNNGMGIHKETIIDTLWPDYNPQRALPLLQTSVCKLRNIFSPLQDKVKLEYASNRYCLTVSDCVCDYRFVEDVLSDSSQSIDDDFALVERAAQLVSKGFLKGQGYLWSMEREEQLRTRLCTKLRNHTDNCLSTGDCAGAVRSLKPLLEVVPYDEEGSNQLLECYAKLNDGAGIIDHYNWLERVLRDDYDMEPAASTRELYRKLFTENYGEGKISEKST